MGFESNILIIFKFFIAKLSQLHKLDVKSIKRLRHKTELCKRCIILAFIRT